MFDTSDTIDSIARINVPFELIQKLNVDKEAKQGECWFRKPINFTHLGGDITDTDVVLLGEFAFKGVKEVSKVLSDLSDPSILKAFTFTYEALIHCTSPQAFSVQNLFGKDTETIYHTLLRPKDFLLYENKVRIISDVDFVGDNKWGMVRWENKTTFALLDGHLTFCNMRPYSVKKEGFYFIYVFNYGDVLINGPLVIETENYQLTKREIAEAYIKDMRVFLGSDYTLEAYLARKDKDEWRIKISDNVFKDVFCDHIEPGGMSGASIRRAMSGANAAYQRGIECGLNIARNRLVAGIEKQYFGSAYTNEILNAQGVKNG